MSHVLGSRNREPMPVINFNKAVNHAHIGSHLISITLYALKTTGSLERVIRSSKIAHIVAGTAIFLLELSQLLLMVFVVQVLLHGLQE